MRDFYEVLGVARDADAETIKRAYRKLALEYHPDRNNGSKDAEERFREATQAYEALRDPEKRAVYDRYGHAGLQGAGAGAAGFGGFDFSDALEIFMRDFGSAFGFEEVFRGRSSRGRGGRGRRGGDVRVTVPLTLEDVARGVSRSVRVEVLDPCKPCGGTGSEGGRPPVRCTTCGGAGEVRRVQRSLLGQLVSVMPCPACSGEGQQIETRCEACHGRGVQPAEKTVEVEIPAGVSSNDYVTLRGQGHAGVRGAPRGDIILVVEVAADDRFVRDGANLIHELPVTFSQAALGAEVEVPTVDGPARITIPPGTQTGTLLRMRNRGLPHLQGGARGDQIVRVVVWTPTDLTPEQEAALRQLAEVESPAPSREKVERDRDGGFWSKVRGAFSL